MRVTADGAVMTASENFPSALRAICDPALALEGAPASVDFCRGFRLGGRAALLTVRIRENGVTALVFPEAALSGDGAALIAQTPTLFEKAESGLGAAELVEAAGKLGAKIRNKHQSAADAAAARLFGALGEPGQFAPSPIEAADETAFWGAVGALLAAAPETLRPAFSAFFSTDPEATPPPGFLLRAEPSPPAPPSGAAKAALEAIAVAGAAPLSADHDAATDGSTLSLEFGLEDALVARLSRELAAFGPAKALERYAVREDAEPPEPKSEVEALLVAEAALEALRTGVAAGEPLREFGVARCAGWLAGQEEAATLWPALLVRGAERGDWRALSLAEPEEFGAVASVRAWTRLRWAERQTRAAAPDGVLTPFDAPVFRARLEAAAANAPAMLIEDPLALACDAAPIDMLAEALTGQDPRALSRPIDALELGSELSLRETPPGALERLARAARRLRKESGLAAARGRFDRPPVPVEHPQAAHFFAACWVHCLEIRAWRGAAFWRDRFFAWCEQRDSEGAEAVEDALHGLRRMAAGAGAAGRHVLAEPSLAGASVATVGGESAVSAVAPADTQASPPDEPQEPAPTERRAHLRPNALQEALAAIRKGEEQDEPDVAVAETAAENVGDDEAAALDRAATLIGGYREDFAAEAARRADGGSPRPLELRSVDKKSFTAALDAAAGLALRDLAAAEVAYGAPIAWSLRQLAGLGRKPAQRPPFEAAPEAVRGVWASLPNVLAAPSEDAAFLGLLSELLQAWRTRRLGANLATDGLFNALPGAPLTKMVGAESISYSKNTLREYLYQGRRGEPKGGFEALPDEAVAARMDRALLVFSLLDCVDEPREASPDTLLAPLTILPDGPEIKALTPSDPTLERLGLYLTSDSELAAIHRSAFNALMQSRGLVHNAALAQLWRRLPRA